MNLAAAWREQAENIREQAKPVQERADQIKATMRKASGFAHDSLLNELRQINRQLEKIAREASNADAMAIRELGGLR